MNTYDLGTLGPASVVSNGLQGLLEAYKIKLNHDTENAKIMQSGATIANSMAEHRMTIDEKKREYDTPPRFLTIPDPNTPGGFINVGIGNNGHITNLTRKTAAGADKKSAALDSAAAAFMALDNYEKIASGFAPESSKTLATARAPWDFMRGHLQATSPQANLSAVAGDAATLYATAVNKAGGGRMTDSEIHNMANAMGGSGVGQTQENIAGKHGPLKDQLAAKLGVSRGEIEAYIEAQRNAQDNGASVGGPMQTLRRALPSARAAASTKGKYAHLSDEELRQAMAEGQ